MALKKEIILGEKYNRLTIIKEVEQRGIYRYVQCNCDCGNIKNIRLCSLRNGATKSCGCFALEVFIKRGKDSFKHGMIKSNIYYTYSGIKDRCYNVNIPNYKNYGGRGIKCLWDTFEEFYKDMGESYEKHLKEFGKKNTSIDRIDNNGNYCKENCRWATMKEQGRNRRSNINYKGKCISEWCEELGLNRRKTVYLLSIGKTYKELFNT